MKKQERLSFPALQRIQNFSTQCKKINNCYHWKYLCFRRYPQRYLEDCSLPNSRKSNLFENHFLPELSCTCCSPLNQWFYYQKWSYFTIFCLRPAYSFLGRIFVAKYSTSSSLISAYSGKFLKFLRDCEWEWVCARTLPNLLEFNTTHVCTVRAFFLKLTGSDTGVTNLLILFLKFIFMLFFLNKNLN